MKTSSLVEVLSSHENCTHKDGTIEISDATEVALYASLGSEMLVIDGLSKIVVTEDLVLASSRKGDTYAVVAEDLRMVRVGKGRGARRTGLI